MQKMLQYANKLPTRDIIANFAKESNTLEFNMLACKRGMKKHLKDLVKL